MRIIECEKVTEAVARLCRESNICIGADIRSALVKARDSEKSAAARSALDTLIKNAEVAQRENLPACQDTGMAVVFVSLGADVHVNGNISEAINEGVRRGYKDGFFRNSVVSDPVRRVNTADNRAVGTSHPFNTPAVIHYDFDSTNPEQLRITVAPKGFGSENMSGLAMLKPSDGIEGVGDFAVETVRRAGANPCPPVIVGIGVGGTMEKSAILAKRGLLREVGSVNPDEFWAESERRILERVNALGIGVSGYGGMTTALGVHILTYPTHIAGLPVAVNIGCHCTRHKEVVI